MKRFSIINKAGSLLLSAFILLVSIVSIFSPCYASENEVDIVGKWVSVDGGGFHHYLEFFEDGTFTYDVEASQKELKNGTYSKDGNEISVDYSSDDYEFTGFSLVEYEGETVVTFNEQKDYPKWGFHKQEETKSEKQIRFREYDWGTSHDEILKKEITETGLDSSEYSDMDDRLIISGINVAGYDMITSFDFDNNDKLVEGMYLLNEDHSNLTQYYYDYESLVEKYTSVYGEPSDKSEKWYDDLYKNDPSDWGTSIATGKTEFATRWEDSEGNTVSIFLTGDNYEISLLITYSSGDFEREENVDGI